MVLLHIMSIDDSLERSYKVADSTTDLMKLMGAYGFMAITNTIKYNIINVTEDDRDEIISNVEKIATLTKEAQNSDLLGIVRQALGFEVERLLTYNIGLIKTAMQIDSERE